MITIKDLERKYGKRIKRTHYERLDLTHPYVQATLEKALRYELTSADYNEIAEVGMRKSDIHPGLYYIACIYIHPLTAVSFMADGLAKMGVDPFAGLFE